MMTSDGWTSLDMGRDDVEGVVSAAEVGTQFGELMQRVVDQQETVIVERDGDPQVAIMPVTEYERLRGLAEPEDWWDKVLRVRELIRLELGDRELPPVEEVIRQMREERDEQLLENLRGYGDRISVRSIPE